jgi:hypothetical protein
MDKLKEYKTKLEEILTVQVTSGVPKLTLKDMSFYHIKDKPNSILGFHGTVMKYKDAIKSNIDWTKANGTMGRGFYMALNPNDSLSYACISSHHMGRYDEQYVPVLFEFIINNADKLSVAPFTGPNAPDAASDFGFKRPYNDLYEKYDIFPNTYFIGQFAGRDELNKNIEIRNIYIMDMNKFRVGGMFNRNKSRIPIRPCWSRMQLK